MTEKILFGIIAALLLCIAALGIYEAAQNRSAVAGLPSTFAGVVSNVVGIEGGGAKAPTSTPTAPTAKSAGATYTMQQVAEHNSAASCYTAINGSVYDLTPFITQHPGGRAAILSLCGVDGTSAFEAQHGGQRRPERELATLRIGTLAQ